MLAIYRLMDGLSGDNVQWRFFHTAWGLFLGKLKHACSEIRGLASSFSGIITLLRGQICNFTVSDVLILMVNIW